VPYIMTGLRLAAPASVIAAIVAEYFGGLQNGLGSRITSAAANTAYDTFAKAAKQAVDFAGSNVAAATSATMKAAAAANDSVKAPAKRKAA